MSYATTASLKRVADESNYDKLLASIGREKELSVYTLACKYRVDTDLIGDWGPLAKAAERGDYCCYPPNYDDFRKMYQELMNFFLSPDRVDSYLQLFFLLHHDLVLKKDDSDNFIFSWE